MFRRFIFTLLTFLALTTVGATVYGQTRQALQGDCELGGQVVTTDGRPSTTKVQRSYPSCTITVYTAGTVTLATIYSNSGGTPKANPFTADADGHWLFWGDPGQYDVRLSGGGIITPFTRSYLWIPTTGGGGGGGDVTGPASSTNSAITRYDGTTGKLIKNSTVTLDDSGNLSGATLGTGNTLGDVTVNVTGSDSTGDIYYRSAGGLLTRLGIGSTNQMLTVAGGLPAWAAPANLSDTNYINPVLEYGATCDGVTNTQTPMQNAINAAVASTTRKTVFIPGDCVVTGLTVTGPVILLGSGQGSVLRSSSNAPIVDLVADANFVGGSVQNLKISGSVSAGSSQIGVRMDNATGALRFLVRDVLIENTGGDGLYWGNAFSSVVDNVRITESAGYNWRYNAPNQPSNLASNIYIGRVRASQPVAYYIQAGDFTGYNLNGIDNLLSGSIWMQVGTAANPATAVLNGFNAESWTSRGFKVMSSSSVVLDGVSLIVGDGATPAASKIGIEFTLDGDGSTFFAPLIKRSKIGDQVNFADGVAAYNNSQPIQAPGFAPIDLEGLGPQIGGTGQLQTYRNTTTSSAQKLARSDARWNKTAITSSTTVTNIGANYFEVDSTSGPVTLTLEWPGWAVPGTPIIVKDVGNNAFTNNITIAASSGGTVNGSTFVMQKNGEAVVLMPNGAPTGSDFRVVARSLAVIGDVSKVTAAAVADYFPYWNSFGQLTSQGPIYRLSNSLVVLESFLNNSNNLYDIGSLSSNRFRTAYLGTSVDVGINSSQTGSVVLRNSTNANATTISPGTPSSALNITLFDTLPASAGCLQVNSSGVISQTGSACGSGGSGIPTIGSSTDNAIVRWDGSGGSAVQNSTVIVGDTGNITGVGTLNTHTIPGGTDTFAMLAATQTLTNKTLTAPVIATIVNTGTLTLPTSTDTLVGRATTDTLTNKALSTSTSVSASISWGDGVTQTFNPNGTSAGINVGSQAGDPSALNNGDVWYNSTTNKFRCRENGASVDCIGSGGGGTVTGSGTTNSIPKWSGATSLTDSGITDTGTTITVLPVAASSGSARQFAVRNPGATGLTASTEVTAIQLGGDGSLASTTMSHATGAITLQRDLRVIPVTHAFTGSSTITTAITMDMASPIAGTNATLTNSVVARLLPSAAAHHGLWIENTSGSATGDLLRLSVSGVNLVRFIPNNGDLNSVFSDSALGTTATDGFVYLPSMAGVPTGVPTSYTGTVPVVVDTTNNRFYGYAGGAWRNLTGSGVADPGANGVMVRTALNTTTARTLTGTANRITITNGDGTAGNPTFDIGTDVVTLTGTQTLTNKTLTSPVIATIVNTGTLTLPTSTDTLVGRATTDTLTNKTLSTGTAVSAAISFTAGVRQTFAPNATTPGLNVGSVAGDPSTPNNADIWYDSTNNLLRARINGATVSLGAGGGGSPGGSSGQVQWNNGGAFAGMAGSTITILGYQTYAPTASTSGSPTLFTLTGPAHTTLAADTEATDVNWNLARTVQFTGGAGAFTTQRAVRIQAPTYSASTTETVSNAITLEVASPSAGTNMTLTNSFASRFVQSAAAHIPVAISLAASPTGDALQVINNSGTAILALTSDGYVVNGATLSQSNYTIKNSSGSGGFELDGFSGALYLVPRGGPAAGNNFIFRTPAEVDYVIFNSSVRGIGVNVTPTTAGHFVSNSTSAGSVLAVSAGGATVQTFEVQHIGSETNAVSLVNLISNNSNGTAATGFGQRTRHRLESSTTNDRIAVEQDVLWSDATDASRTARYALRTVNAASIAETWGVQGNQNYGAAEFDRGNSTGSFTIDWNNGNNQRATATGNWTTVSFSNIKVGAQYTLRVIQDATGGRTWTPPTTMKFPGGVSGNILTGTANAQDLFVCISSDGTNLYCNGLFDVKNP